MTGRGDGSTEAAGGPARHVPVLLAEVCAALGLDSGPGVAVDGTFGAGGYAQALLAAHRDNRVIALDRDSDALAAGSALAKKAGRRLTLVEARFGDLDEVVRAQGFDRVDRVVLDVGLSSMQLDEAQRGFSFRFDGPLDMRMSREGPSAADIVNEGSEAELADILHFYGEERRARAVARAITERRRRSPIATTAELAELVSGLVRAEPNGPHPATRVFQALRIAVNDELGELVRALHAAERVLKPGGRLAIVTFHSLEDRIVKQFFAARTGRMAAGSRHMPAPEAREPSFLATIRGPVLPSDAEVAANPRARSAKLRAAERTEAPAQPVLSAIEALAELPRPIAARSARR